MPRPLRRLLVPAIATVAVLVIAAQLVPMNRSNPPSDPAQGIHASMTVPPNVRSAIDRSCRDCHTNDTRWPWYAYVAPASWLLVSHVNEGREHLNFSTWGTNERDRLGHLLEEMCDEVREGKMPLPSYTLIHRNARLSSNEVSAICGWTESTRAALASPLWAPAGTLR